MRPESLPKRGRFFAEELSPIADFLNFEGWEQSFKGMAGLRHGRVGFRLMTPVGASFREAMRFFDQAEPLLLRP